MRGIAKMMYGDTLTVEDLILVDLLEKNAIDAESAVPVKEYSMHLLEKHAKEKRVVIIEGEKVYLTEIGRRIAIGLRDIWLKSEKEKVVESIKS